MNPPEDSPVRAGIIVTGTEVLTGVIPDWNGPWLAEWLGREGVEVAYTLIVGDRPEDMLEALDFLRASGVDLTVTTGGLGPTADDLTCELVARFTGRELKLDQGMEARIGEILAEFAKRRKLDPEALAESNRKQAMLPEGAISLDPVGTAPGFLLPDGDELIVVLPGPPRELQPMWERAVKVEPLAGLLASAGSFQTARLRLFGLPESEIAATLRGLEAGGVDLQRIEITTCLRKGELEVDLRWRESESVIARAVQDGIASRHQAELYSADGRTIDQMIADSVGSRSVAVAESLTGGLVAGRLTARPGASEFFAGGVCAYSNAAKSELLDVPAELIEAHGAVSGEVARSMAEGALKRFDAQFAVSTTGVAGPAGGSEQKPVGYVCFCALSASGELIERDPVIPGGRADVRERSVLAALHMLRELIERSG